MKLLRKNHFRTLASPIREWGFQHATVVEQNIEIGFSLIISIYKVVYVTVTDLHAGYAATRWKDLLSKLSKCAVLDWW